MSQRAVPPVARRQLGFSEAAEKELAGAGMTSFMEKCERDAATACDASAKEKKLAGAGKASFTKKCVSE